MGTVFRSNCGCLQSAPEPDRSEWTGSDSDFDAAWSAWDTDWQRQNDEHDPRSCEEAQQGNRRNW